MKTKVDQFYLYYEKWVTQLEIYLQRLLIATAESPPATDAELQELVTMLTAHHKDYYTKKWAAAQEDVLAFFSPAWTTPLENAYLWFTGWKPSTAFRLVANLKKSGVAAALHSLSEDQVKRIDQLRVKIKYEEEKVDAEMERQQVSLADRRLLELARIAGRVTSMADGPRTIGGDGSSARVSDMVDVAVRSMAAGLERVMKTADCLRLKTLKGLLDLMSPPQCVEFLAAISMLQIQLKQWGHIHGRMMSKINIIEATPKKVM